MNRFIEINLTKEYVSGDRKMIISDYAIFYFTF